MTSSHTAPTSWRIGMVRQLDELGRWIQGRFLPAPGPGAGAIPATRFFGADYLRETIEITTMLDAGSRDPAQREFDFTIAVSRFARWYCSSLSVVALVGLARGIGLDLSPERCWLTPREVGQFLVSVDLSDEEVLRCAQRQTEWVVGGPTVDTLDELREYVWSKLYGAHIAPLFARIRALRQVSDALLWTSAAEYVGNVSDSAEEYLTAAQAEPFVADRSALLCAEELPGVPGSNPLRGRLEWVPVEGGGFPRRVQTRQVCCLCYLLDMRDGALCQNCPYLPAENRAALVRERHGVALGGQPGPAFARAREVGRQRVAIRRRRSTPGP